MSNVSFGSRLKSAWNAFFSRDPTEPLEMPYENISVSSYYRPDRFHYSRGNERSIVTAIYNRIALDVSAINIKHVRLDENGRYLKDIDSSLNECLTLQANMDQTSRAFFQDVVASMVDEGCVAIVPTDTDKDPFQGSFDILTMRTGKIKQWFPYTVQVEVYNERIGQKQDIVMPKEDICIIENPLYSVMNEPNSTLQRLIRKLSLLDMVDERNNSGKLDLIFQLPYSIRSKLKRDQADQRRQDIENQLVGSKYGIAYIDATEHVTQLNRPAENNLMSQVEYLTSMLYSQLGITQEILNGTADEHAMLNYNNRTIEPIISAITDEMKRKFLTPTARSQKQSIMFFTDPFRLVPVSNIAEIADKFTRNEIMTSNEIRQVIGMVPSKDPEADELRNKNLSKPKEDGNLGVSKEEINAKIQEQVEEIQNVQRLRFLWLGYKKRSALFRWADNS